MPLTSFQLGKLKIAAHVREELDRAGLAAASIQCLSDGVHLPLGHTRLTIAMDGRSAHLDLMAHEVEDCAVIVAGDTWRNSRIHRPACAAEVRFRGSMESHRKLDQPS